MSETSTSWITFPWSRFYPLKRLLVVYQEYWNCCVAFLLRLKDNILSKNVPESRYDSWHDQKQIIDVMSYFDYQNICKIKFFFKLSKISENFRRMNIFGNLEIAFQV